MRRRWLVLLGLCVALSGCGQGLPVRPSATAANDGASVAPSTGALPSPPPGTPRPSASRDATEPSVLYFTAAGKLAPVTSQVATSSPARQALEQLLKGPADAEHSTEIPPGARLLDVSISGETATVSFNDAFFTPAGATGTLLRLAQVVYTVTQFAGVTSVLFLQSGRPVDLIGEGFPLNRPLKRTDLPSVQA